MPALEIIGYTCITYIDVLHYLRRVPVAKGVSISVNQGALCCALYKAADNIVAHSNALILQFVNHQQ